MRGREWEGGGGSATVCMYVCMYVHVCMYMYLCMYVHVYIYVYVCTCRKVYPPSPFLAQREGCPWSHAVGKKTKELAKCFDKLKWEPKKAPPKNKRDHGQRLVPRVQAWTERWKKTTNSTTENNHSFAREEVGIEVD